MNSETLVGYQSRFHLERVPSQIRDVTDSDLIAKYESLKLDPFTIYDVEICSCSVLSCGKRRRRICRILRVPALYNMHMQHSTYANSISTCRMADNTHSLSFPLQVFEPRHVHYLHPLGSL